MTPQYNPYQDPHFKDKDILEALLYLHMTGEVLHFVGIPGLKDYVFVSPTWLIDVIKCVISPDLQSTLDTGPLPGSKYVLTYQLANSCQFFIGFSLS